MTNYYCKNECYNYKLCKALGNVPNDLEVFESCNFAISKSRIIELPCKVEDEIYVLNRGNIPQKMILDEPNIRCHCAKEDNLCMALSLSNEIKEKAKPDFIKICKNVGKKTKTRKFRAMTIGEYCEQAECKKCEYHYGAFCCDYSNFNGIHREHSKPYKTKDGKYIFIEVRE